MSGPRGAACTCCRRSGVDDDRECCRRFIREIDQRRRSDGQRRRRRCLVVVRPQLGVGRLRKAVFWRDTLRSNKASFQSLWSVARCCGIMTGAWA